MLTTSPSYVPSGTHPADSSSNRNVGQLSKLKQRKMDRLRRRKEAQLIQQLATYAASATATAASSSSSQQRANSAQSSHSASSQPASSGQSISPAGNAAKKRGKERLQVLEACLDNFHSMEEVCQLLRATVNRQQEQIEQLSRQTRQPPQQPYTPFSPSLFTQQQAPLFSPTADEEQTYSSFPSWTVASEPVDNSIVAAAAADEAYSSTSPSSSSLWLAGSTSTEPPSLADELTQLALSRSLYSQALLQARVALLIVDVNSGLGLDANEAYVTFSGFSRPVLQQRQLVAQHSSVVGWEPITDPADVPSSIRRRGGKRLRLGHSKPKSVDAIFTPAAVTVGLQQYPQTLQLLQDLYTGKRIMINAVWRCPHSDGSVWENSHTSWIAKTDADVNQAGEPSVRPKHIVFASSYEEATKL